MGKTTLRNECVLGLERFRFSPMVALMDTIIFIAIFATLLAMWLDKSRSALAAYGVSLVAVLGLFAWHLTSSLGLCF